MWLKILLLLRRGWLAPALVPALVPVLMLLAGNAAAGVNLNFDGSAAPANCSKSGNTYTCSTLTMAYDDRVVIASGYTLSFTNDFTLGYNQGLTMSGSAVLQSTGGKAIDLSSPPSGNLSVSGGTISAAGALKLGSQNLTAAMSGASVTTSGQTTITGNISASGAVSLGDSTTVNGSVTAGTGLTIGGSTTISGAVSGNAITTGSTVKMASLAISGNGSINLGSSNTISGAVSGGSITTNSSVIMGALTISGAVNLGSSNTVNGSVSAASITTNSSVTINGSVNTPNGTANLGSAIKITGNVVANAVQTGSPGAIDGAITSTTTIAIGSGLTVGGNISGTTITTTSPVTLNGSVTASVSFTLASGSSVTGNIKAPAVTLEASNSTVKGNIDAVTSLDMGSGTVVTGAVTVTNGSLTMRPSNAIINGTVKISGDVDMGSGTTINGDLTARNVTTRASNAVVNGNAAVNAIYIDWGNNVTGTITCTGPGAALCSCVTKADPNWQPRCGAASSGLDHVQITHSGSALTCQPQTVTLQACANASCSSTYNGATKVTLTPNGGEITFTGSTTASVSQASTGTASLAVTGASYTCVNTGSSGAANSCQMTFSDNGLQLSAADHVSMESAKLNIQALTSGPNNSSCVPLVKNATVPVNVSCAYKNPASGTLPLTLGSGNTEVKCNGSTTTVQMAFDANGLATPALKYPDVGLMSVNASYGSGTLNASGNTSFTTAPKSFKVEGTVTATTPATLANGAFARAGDSFNLTVSAINANGAVTPNFGRETSPESFSLTESLKLPSGGVNAFSPASFDAISAGVAKSKSGTAGQWYFKETGTITLNAALTNSSAYYMGKTVTGFNTKGTLDLRFVPHHFNTELVPGTPVVPMLCATLNSYNNPCGALSTTGSFIYSKQPFQLKVGAYKDDTTLSDNYTTSDTNSVAKAITLDLMTANGGATKIATTVIKAIDPAVVKFTFSKGTGSHGGAWPTLEFAATQSLTSATAPTTAYLRATDEDLATSLRPLVGTTNPTVEAPLTVVSGRMVLANNYGSSSTPMPVEARATYYSGAASAWLFNPAFSPTLPASPSALVPGFQLLTSDGLFVCSNGLTCPLTLVASTMAFKNGKASFSVAATKASGSATVSLNKTTVIDKYIPYLPLYDTARLTFGIYRSGPVIYTREVYN